MFPAPLVTAPATQKSTGQRLTRAGGQSTPFEKEPDNVPQPQEDENQLYR